MIYWIITTIILVGLSVISILDDIRRKKIIISLETNINSIEDSFEITKETLKNINTDFNILKKQFDEQLILLNEVLADDETQRKNVILIKDKFDEQFNLMEKLANFYNQMLDKMKSLDNMRGYETQDDFGVFFKYVKQSLYEIHEIYEEVEIEVEAK